MLWWLLFLAVLLIVLPWLILPHKEHKFHAGAASLQAIVTILVAVVAGYWYLVERRGTAHANVELSAVGVKLDEDTVLVQARVSVENTGQILLVPQELDVRLLSVVPARTFPLDAAAALAVAQYDRWPSRLLGAPDAPAYHANELQWTSLRYFRGRADQEIEPGERDVRVLDMLVPCEIRAAKLSIQLRKPSPEWWQSDEPPGGWWWTDRLLFSLRELCMGEVGMVATLEPWDDDDDEDRDGEEQRR